MRRESWALAAMAVVKVGEQDGSDVGFATLAPCRVMLSWGVWVCGREAWRMTAPNATYFWSRLAQSLALCSCAHCTLYRVHVRTWTAASRPTTSRPYSPARKIWT